MKGKRIGRGVLATAFVLALLAGLALAQEPDRIPLGTAFTYQGQLKRDGAPHTGTCDIQFSLFDVPTGGTAVATLTKTNVAVDEGFFTVQLDYGTGRFAGDKRWLEMSVRCPAGAGSYQLLDPRQEVTASPYALYSRAAPWSGLAGVPAGFADGVDNDTTYSADTGLVLFGTTFSADTAYLQQRVTGQCSTGSAIRVVNADGTVTCEPVGGGAWSLTGNAGTVPGTDYLGASDDAALEIKVNKQRALRLEPMVDQYTYSAPNLVGGYGGNWLTDGVHGATIAGGGQVQAENHVTDHWGAVGGGIGNQAGDGEKDVGSAPYATVAGGFHNRANDVSSTIPGGADNTAAAGQYSLAAGRRAKANHDGAFVWADSTAQDFASTAANQFLVRATGGAGINTNAPVANTLTVGGSGLRVATDGTTFRRVQAGTATLGQNPGGGVKRFAINFPAAFSAVPSVIATPRGDSSHMDAFVVTTVQITASKFEVNVYRVDNGGGSWGQYLQLDWMAWE